MEFSKIKAIKRGEGSGGVMSQRTFVNANEKSYNHRLARVSLIHV